MNDEQALDLLIGKSLGILDPADEDSARDLLASEASGEEDLLALDRIVAALSLTAPHRTPPADCRSRLLDEVDRQMARQGAPAGSPRFSHRPSQISWFPWALAAAASIVAAFLVRETGSLRSQLAEAAPLRVEVDRLRAEVMGPPTVQYAALRASAPASSAYGQLIFCAKLQEGRLLVKNLAPLPNGEAYQVWVTSANHAAPLRVASFKVQDQGTQSVRFEPPIPLDTVQRVLVTHDSEKPTTPAPERQVLASL